MNKSITLLEIAELHYKYVRAVCQLYESGVIPEGISESVISDLIGVHYALSTKVEGHQEKPVPF